MQLEATLRIVFYAAIGLCAMLMCVGLVVGQRAEKGSKTAMLAGVLVIVLDVALVFATRSLAAKIGPVISSIATTIASAMTFGYIGGLWAGRQIRSKKPAHQGAVIPALLIMLIMLYSIYATGQRLAQGAKEFGVGQGGKYEPEKNKDCPENLKSLYLALSSYAQDWDALPPAENWLDNEEIASKIVKDEWMHCPAVSDRQDAKFGYAYNEGLASKSLKGKPLKEIPDGAKTPLIYDSTNLTKNAHDKITSLPEPGRHGGRNNILYCDGHVEAVEPGKR